MPCFLRALRGGPLAAATLTVFLLVAAASLPASATAATRELRVGSVPPLPAGVTLLGASAAAAPMKVTIALTPRDPVALATYAREVSTPGSPDYRHFLSTAQFRAQFAPTAATVRALRRSLRAHGLELGRLDASGLALSVRAPGGELEHAFGLTLARVRLRGGRDAIFNAQAPAFDARVAPDVQAVIGLSTLYPSTNALERAREQRASGAIRGQRAAESGHRQAERRAHDSLPQIATGGPQPCSKAVDDAPGYGGYTADQIASYYDFSPLYRAGDKGQGVTVALYELEPVSPTDIEAYQQCYDTDTQISYVKVDGGAGAGIGSGEAALDIDQIIGLAPKVKLLVYQGPNSNSGSGPYDLYAAIANQDKASVVSTSWGSCEPEETQAAADAEQTVFEQMAIQGQTLVAAAGDSGSEDCFVSGSDADNSLEVDDPASQPFVTGAGGTSLELGAFNIGDENNPYYPVPNPDETVWNNSYPYVNYFAGFGISPGAGGGGISRFWPMPAYQSDTVASAPWLNVVNAESSGTNCAAAAGSYCREVPDVSANADPMDGYMSYWNGQGTRGNALSGWQSVGGTSAVAPLWAAIFALADASNACAGNLVGFANPALYALASSSPSAYASYFNDITSDAINQVGDENDLRDSGNTSALYQAGSGYDMATGLGTPKAASLVPALCRQSVALRTVGARRSFVGATVRLRLRAVLPAGVSGSVSYTAKNLPTGLRLNPVNGTVTGTITGAGVFDTVLGAQTSSGDDGAHRYVWSVARRPEASALSLSGATSGRPLLAFTVSAGQLESSLSSVTVQLPPGISLTRPVRGITVIGAAGRAVPHRLAIVDGRLVISFRPAHSPDKVEFRAGALGARGALLAGSLRPLQLVLRVVDADGHSSTVRRTIRPVS